MGVWLPGCCFLLRTIESGRVPEAHGELKASPNRQGGQSIGWTSYGHANPEFAHCYRRAGAPHVERGIAGMARRPLSDGTP
jgi:hypothetical protein